MVAAPLQVCVYDPQVEDDQIYQDLGTEKFEWDHPSPRSRPVPKSAIDIASVSKLPKSTADGMLRDPGGWSPQREVSRPSFAEQHHSCNSRWPAEPHGGGSRCTRHLRAHRVGRVQGVSRSGKGRLQQLLHCPAMLSEARAYAQPSNPPPPTPTLPTHPPTTPLHPPPPTPPKQAYDYQAIYDTMVKPAFVFDGRNILDHQKLRDIGFIVYALGKPLDPFLQKHYD